MKVKRPATRRQKTRRRLLLCLLILGGILLLHPPSLSPTQALRATEEQLGLAQTEILAQEKLASATLTLSSNEDVLMITRFHPLLTPLQLSPPYPLFVMELLPQNGPIWAGFLSLQEMDGFRLLGRIDVPGAAAVRVYPAGETAPSQGMQQDLFSHSDGHQYLWAAFPSPTGDRVADVPDHLEVLDQSGQVLAHYDIHISLFH